MCDSMVGKDGAQEPEWEGKGERQTGQGGKKQEVKLKQEKNDSERRIYSIASSGHLYLTVKILNVKQCPQAVISATLIGNNPHPSSSPVNSNFLSVLIEMENIDTVTSWHEG